MLIKDTMVVIHLAKLSILEKSCECFKKVFIPEKVYQEITKGDEKGFAETPIITDLVKSGKILIKRVKNKELISKAIQHTGRRSRGCCIILAGKKGYNRHRR